MKKFIRICICLCTVFSVFAQETTALDESAANGKTADERKVIINDLLAKKQLKENYDKIYNEAKFLSFDERNQIYKKQKDDAFAPFALNFFIGYGIGSFVQKDYLSGAICVATDLTSFALAVTGLILWKKELFDITHRPQQNADVIFDTIFSGTSAFPCLIAGGILSLCSHIYGAIAPWVFSAFYNNKLEGALGLKDTQISFAPFIMPDASAGFALSIRY